MSTVNLTSTDKPKQGDGLKSLFSKKLNRIANIGDLMNETIRKGDKSVTVYFKPATRILYVPNGAVRAGEAKSLGVNTMLMFGEPYYSAEDLLKHNLIDIRHREGFIKRTAELTKHFISVWTS